MKRRYVVYSESGYIDANGKLANKEIKSFRNEQDAKAYIARSKNYNAFLERHDADGKKYDWNESRGVWEEIA